MESFWDLLPPLLSRVAHGVAGRRRQLVNPSQQRLAALLRLASRGCSRRRRATVTSSTWCCWTLRTCAASAGSCCRRRCPLVQTCTCPPADKGTAGAVGNCAGHLRTSQKCVLNFAASQWSAHPYGIPDQRSWDPVRTLLKNAHVAFTQGSSPRNAHQYQAQVARRRRALQGRLARCTLTTWNFTNDNATLRCLPAPGARGCSGWAPPPPGPPRRRLPQHTAAAAAAPPATPPPCGAVPSPAMQRQHIVNAAALVAMATATAANRISRSAHGKPDRAKYPRS